MNKKHPIKIIKLGGTDLTTFRTLIALFEDVFEMQDFKMPSDSHLRKVLGREHFDVFVAICNEKVVGGLTTYVLEQYYSERSLAYIYDLAVDHQWQRQGVGKQLIAATRAYYEAQGFEEVFVQADRVDAHAVNFYRSTQPSEEEDVLHFYYTLNP